MILILQSLDGTMELNTLVYNKYSITISLFSFLKKKKRLHMIYLRMIPHLCMWNKVHGLCDSLFITTIGPFLLISEFKVMLV